MDTVTELKRKSKHKTLNLSLLKRIDVEKPDKEETTIEDGIIQI